MTTFIDDGFEQVFKRAPGLLFGAGGVLEGLKVGVAGLGRLCYGCAAATGPDVEPVAKGHGGAKTAMRDEAVARLQGRGDKKYRAKTPAGNRAGGIPAGACGRNGIPGPALKPAEDPGTQGSMAAAVVGQPRTSVVVS